MDANNEAAVWNLFREAAEKSDCQVRHKFGLWVVVVAAYLMFRLKTALIGS